MLQFLKPYSFLIFEFIWNKYWTFFNVLFNGNSKYYEENLNNFKLEDATEFRSHMIFKISLLHIPFNFEVKQILHITFNCCNWRVQ